MTTSMYASTQHSQTGGPFARAAARTSFTQLVRVEFRKLGGTVSDRILLAVSPILLIGVNAVVIVAAGLPVESAQYQIALTVWTIPIAHSFLHAAVIKLVAGEWQHRSAQPTILVQPSRMRYFFAQATVVFVVWLAAAALQLAATLIFTPMRTDAAGVGYVLDYRIGWVISVVTLGSWLAMMVALTVAMLVPNSPGALAIYFVAVPAMLVLTGVAWEYMPWVNPSTAAFTLATLDPIEGPAPVIVSLTLWVGLLLWSAHRVARRDLA